MRNWRWLAIVVGIMALSACDSTNDLASKNSTSEIVVETSSDDVAFDLEIQRKEFALTEFAVLDISETEYDKTPALSVSFSVPIDAQTDFNQFLQVSDEKSKRVTGGWILNKSRTRLYFTNIQPQTTYKIEVFAGITAITSKHLVNNVESTLETSNLQAMVRFVSKGGILPSEMTNGLAIESVNFKAVDIDFHRVETSRVGQVLSDGLQGYSYRERNISEIAELVFSGRYDIDLITNKRITTVLPIHHIKQLQQPGYYIAVMKAAGSYPYEHQVISFYISNLGLHARNFSKQINIHALSISHGKPQDAVSIKILSNKGELITSGTTDLQGNFNTNGFENDSVIIATKGKEFAVITLASPALDLSEQLTHTRLQNQQELFLYGPRNLYRPGEEVNVNGLLRGVDGEMIASVPLAATLIRPDSRIAQEFSWHPEQSGFYRRSMVIDKTEPTGEWSLRVKHPSGETFEYPFSVEDFLPERMKLSLISSVEGVVDVNEDITILGQGDYLYGAPAAGNRISASLQIKPAYIPLEILSDYYFGEHVSVDNQQPIILEDQFLNEEGKVNWTLPNYWKSMEHPTQVIFEASLFESGGRPVTRRLKQLVWPKGNHIGLRRLYQSDFVEPFQEAEFELINVNSHGQQSPLGLMEVSLIREDSQYYWHSNQRGWDYSENRKESKVYSRILDISDTSTVINLPVEYGTYRVEVKDSTGKIKNSYQFFAGWSWDDSGEASIKGSRPDIVRVIFEQESHQANDVAKVKLISPYLGRALLRVESNQLLWEQQIDLTALESDIEIPISADWKRHDLYFSIMLIAESEKINQLHSLPKRAIGIAPLRLDRKNRLIELQIVAPELSEPEQTISIAINAPDQAGEETYVTLAAVDTGVLSLANYQTPNAHQWFFGQRAFAGNMRDSFSQLIKNSEGAIGKLKFGGDAELVRGGEQPATDVQIVSLFSELVKFDSQGQALIDLALPRFNGELRLMALAFSNNRFGHQQLNIKVRAPFVAEISKPRFLARDDHSQIGLDLQNMSGEKRSLVAELSVSGGLKTQNISIPVELDDGAKLSKIIPVYAIGLANGKIDLVLKDEQNNTLLKREWKLAVRAAYPAEYRQKSEVLTSGKSFSLDPAWITDFNPDNLQAKISYSTSPPFSSEEHLKNLFEYPYGCLEQTSSRVWPLLFANKLTQSVQLTERSMEVLRDKNLHINNAIQRINGMQRNDGSFGLWSNQSEENHWLSVYAMEFLLSAKNVGYLVPDSVISNGLERLQWYTNSVRTSYTERSHYSQDPEHYAIAFRAYAAYVLSKMNLINLSQLNLLNTQLADKSKSGLPLAHLAAAFENLGDINAAKILWQSSIAYSDYQQNYTGDYGSQLRDQAWIYDLASQSQLASNFQSLIFSINDETRNKRWMSTQEQFAIFRLAIEFENSNTTEWKLGKTNSENEVLSSISASKKLAQTLTKDDFLKRVKLTLQQGDKVFIHLQTVGHPKSLPKAVSQGIALKKYYYDLQGKAVQFEQVKAGEYVLVRLDVLAEQAMPDALLVDLLPAGFEIENPALEFAYDYSDLMIEGYPISQWTNNGEVKHKEYRDDRFVSAISLQQQQWLTQFYLIRAVTAGTYVVPPTQVEDMYRPDLRALGETIKPVIVLSR